MFVVGAATYPWQWWYLRRVPIAWVVAAATGDRSPGGDEARRAWVEREGVTAAYYDHLIDLEADPAGSFGTPPFTYTAMLGDAASSGRLTPGQLDALARVVLDPVVLSARSPVRVGDPLVVTGTRPTRAGAPAPPVVMRSDLLLHARLTVAASADGPPGAFERRWSEGIVGGNFDRAIPFAEWATDGLAPGRHTVHLAAELVLLPRNGPMLHPGTTDGRHAGVGTPVVVRRAVEVEVLPEGAPLGTPVPAPERAGAVAAAVDVGVYHWDEGRVFAEVRLLPVAGVDRAFAVYAVIDGREVRIGDAAAPAGKGGTTNSVSVPLKGDAADAAESLTLVLVGDGEALRESPSQASYWPGRIAYPDVPLGTRADYLAAANAMPVPTTRPHTVVPATR